MGEGREGASAPRAALRWHRVATLADLCDGVLFVVRAGETSYEIAKKASSEFRDKNLIGVVMNQVDKSQSRGDYYYNAEKK